MLHVNGNASKWNTLLLNIFENTADASFAKLGHRMIKTSLGGFIVTILPLHKDFSPSGEQLKHRKLAHEL